MEADQVIEKILTDAKAEAGKIKKQADKTQAAEQAKLDEQLKDYNKQTDTLAEKAAEDKKLHLLATARMDIAKQHLAEKRKIIDDVFDQARTQLQNLPDDQYAALMSKLMLEAVETGDEEIIIGKNEKRIDQKFVKHINRELGPGFKGNLRLANERHNLTGGFILRRGKIKNNVSLDILLARARKELEIQLAKELFA